MKQRRQMILSVVPPFYDNELYIKSIFNCINCSLGRFRAPPQAIIVSYHGIPLSYHSSGDPYGFQCKRTTALLRFVFNLQESERVILRIAYHVFQINYMTQIFAILIPY